MRLSVQIEFDKTLDLVTHKKSVIVGRSPKCDLVIPHESISRNHCQIEIIKGLFYITDLGSSNGVTVNGQRIPPKTKVALATTSQVSLGKLECEISESAKIEQNSPKIISSTVADTGDFTATMRISRIELNRPSITLELEKKPIVKGPRNPITEKIKPAPKPKKEYGRVLLLVLAALILIAAWFLAPDQV